MKGTVLKFVWANMAWILLWLYDHYFMRLDLLTYIGLLVLFLGYGIQTYRDGIHRGLSMAQQAVHSMFEAISKN